MHCRSLVAVAGTRILLATRAAVPESGQDGAHCGARCNRVQALLPAVSSYTIPRPDCISFGCVGWSRSPDRLMPSTSAMQIEVSARLVAGRDDGIPHGG
jgi:hypothetical protein